MKAWRSVVEKKWKDDDLPSAAVGIAPVKYWRRLRGRCGPGGVVSPEGWAALARLVEKLAGRGFKMHFAEFDQDFGVKTLPPFSSFVKG